MAKVKSIWSHKHWNRTGQRAYEQHRAKHPEIVPTLDKIYAAIQDAGLALDVCEPSGTPAVEIVDWRRGVEERRKSVAECLMVHVDGIVSADFDVRGDMTGNAADALEALAAKILAAARAVRAIKRM